MSALPAGPFTFAEWRATGLSPRRLRTALRAGLARRVLHGVYLRADVPLTLEVKARAVALVVGPDAVVCDRTAAWMWGVDVHEMREWDDVPPVETFVVRGRDPIDRRGVRGGTRDLAPQDWVEIHGLRVTTPLRTAMDLGCALNRREALAAMDALMRVHRFSHAELARTLPRYVRRRGVVQLRELAPLVDPRAESPRESWTRLELHDHGLPTPELQWWVTVNGVATYRLDLAYPNARIAIEYDGEDFHSSEADQARDLMRRAWLREHGWIVVVIDKSAFARSADLGWIIEVRDALVEAQRRPRRRYVTR